MRTMTKPLAVAAGVIGCVWTVSLPRAAAATPRCEPSGTLTVSVTLTPPAATPLAGVKVRLDYPAEAVAIPGAADADEVKARVRDMPSAALAVPNDEDDHLIVAMVATTPIPAGRIFTVELDRCAGSAVPKTAQFGCAVQEASDEQAKLVDGARCAVSPANDKEGANP